MVDSVLVLAKVAPPPQRETGATKASSCELACGVEGRHSVESLDEVDCASGHDCPLDGCFEKVVRADSPTLGTIVRIRG